MKFAYITKADRKFFWGVAALLRSLRKFDVASSFFVFDCGLDSKQIDFLRTLNCQISPMVFEHYSRLETTIGTHYNDSIYALMHIKKLDIDSFVHLDADTVVFPEIEKIKECLEDFEFVGILDYPALSIGDNVGNKEQQEIVQNLFPLVRALDEVAVNAGVFGAKMSAFRKFIPIMQKAYESELVLHRRDQTLLNVALPVLDPSSVMLDIHFNFRHYFRRSPEIKISGTCIKNGYLHPVYEGQDIAVMHFIGPDKPWMCGFDKSCDAYRVWEQFSCEKEL